MTYGEDTEPPQKCKWKEKLPSKFPVQHQWVLKNKTSQDLDQNLKEISPAEFISQSKDQVEETHLGEYVVIWLKFSL